MAHWVELNSMVVEGLSAGRRWPPQVADVLEGQQNESTAGTIINYNWKHSQRTGGWRTSCPTSGSPEAAPATPAIPVHPPAKQTYERMNRQRTSDDARPQTIRIATLRRLQWKNYSVKIETDPTNALGSSVRLWPL